MVEIMKERSRDMSNQALKRQEKKNKKNIFGLMIDNFSEMTGQAPQVKEP